MLSIVIVNYKTPDILRICIKSIKDATQSTQHEVIVVDSESDGELGDVLQEEFPGIKFLFFENNAGYAKCVNAGLKIVKGEFILVLNADIIAEKDSIEKMLEYLKSQNKVGMIGPKLVSFNGKSQYSAFRFYTPFLIILRRTFLGKLKFGKKALNEFLLKDKNIENLKIPLKVDWLMGSALLLKKRAFEKVGGMDENFFMYFEDVDWALRFWQNGFEVVYFPQTKMHHFHGQVSKKIGSFDIFFNKMTWAHIKSAVYYFKKHGLKTTHYV